MKKIGMIAFSIIYLMATANSSMASCSVDSYAGSICFTAGKYCPEGHLSANGSTQKIRDYPALYATIGMIYGGSETSGTFNLPNLNGRSPVGTGPVSPSDEMHSSYTLGEAVGSARIRLDGMELPAHTHLLDSGGGSTPIILSSLPPTATTATTSSYISANPVDSSGNPIKMFAGSEGQGISLNKADLPEETNINTTQQRPITIQPQVFGLTACISAKGYYSPPN
ncbi:phage tail protein [Azospirillum humicireducens]|nr:tail fiber protein [Azospirillum humicireducens]